MADDTEDDNENTDLNTLGSFMFNRKERLDVKKPGPFYPNSENNFFIKKGKKYYNIQLSNEDLIIILENNKNTPKHQNCDFYFSYLNLMTIKRRKNDQIFQTKRKVCNISFDINLIFGISLPD